MTGALNAALVVYIQ